MSEINEKKGDVRSIKTGFDHDRLEVTGVLLDALEIGVEVAEVLPRGHSDFADQLRRALQGAYLQTCEGAARRGKDRIARLRAARAEAGEAAGAAQGVLRLRLAPAEKTIQLVRLLDRAGAMLWGLMMAHGAPRG